MIGQTLLEIFMYIGRASCQAFFWTGANIAATLAVKFCGLGVYFIVHEITNIGGAFLAGVFGRQLGFDTTPPNNIPLAAVGVVFVFIGAIPVVFLRPPEEEAKPAEDEDAAGGITPELSTDSGVFGLHGSTPASKPFGSGKMSSLMDALLPHEVPAQGSSPSDRMAERNALTWDGASPLLHLKKSPSTNSENFLCAFEALPTMPMVLDMFPEAASPKEGEDILLTPVQEDGLVAAKAPERPKRIAVSPFGVACCLICGILWSAMYLPATTWKKRMAKEGIAVGVTDYLFSECVGIYASSTIWMLLVSAWKKVQGKPMEKSVLRPALVAGLVWTAGALGTLNAMERLPYAIAYCTASGGALMVSLGWGMAIFGEAQGRHNKLCILASFLNIIAGVVCLGCSLA
mmetsp:Transcript_51347/g.121986  ORF Transcript_51347/g.121986 Transcript_51347/m.121986 type:complete len:402 (+) Transcript_51347:297-1502(+)